MVFCLATVHCCLCAGFWVLAEGRVTNNQDTKLYERGTGMGKGHDVGPQEWLSRDSEQAKRKRPAHFSAAPLAGSKAAPIMLGASAPPPKKKAKPQQ